MTDRAFPVIYARDVIGMSRFYVRLGFNAVYQFPPDDPEPGYITMQRGDATLGITTVGSPQLLIGAEVGTGPRFEMFVYVDDVDAIIGQLRASGVPVLREAADMPWGERIAYVSYPEGNPVALAFASAT
jgi:lactoylglutathione lyase